MDVTVFSESQLPVALGALGEILAAHGEVSPRGQQYLAEIARFHGAAPAPVRASLEEVAAVIEGPHARKRLVQFALIAALVDGMPVRAAHRAVVALDRGLAVGEPGVAFVGHLVRGRRTWARFAMRRRILERYLRAAYARDGAAGVANILSALFLQRGPKYPETAQRYRRLGLLPSGTLGREFWQHIREAGFDLPGEGGGAIPEWFVFHDVGHVLAGYDLDPAGEIQQGAFQAGFVRRDGFTYLLFVVMQFHLGIPVIPFAKPEVDCFDIPRVMRALARGAACCVDLSDEWRIWNDAPRPLAAVRASLGIPAP